MSDPKAVRRRAERGPVIVECRMCPERFTGSTWRPVRRIAAAHRASQHAGEVVV